MASKIAGRGQVGQGTDEGELCLALPSYNGAFTIFLRAFGKTDKAKSTVQPQPGGFARLFSLVFLKGSYNTGKTIYKKPTMGKTHDPLTFFNLNYFGRTRAQ